MEKRKPGEVEFHTERVYLYSDLEKALTHLRSGSDLDATPAHWPPSLIVDDGPWQPWLPPDWGQGWALQSKVKKRVYISPSGKRCEAKTEVEKVIGHELADATSDLWPFDWGIEWPDWLPQDWGISRKVLSTTQKKTKIWIHPSFQRFFWQRADAEKSIASGLPNKVVNLELGPGALRDAKEEPLSGNTDSEVDALASDDEAERCGGFRIRPFRRSWLVLPEDVQLITLDLFNDRIESVGWKCTQRTSRRYDFENTSNSERVAISLYAARGRLLVRTRSRSVAYSVGDMYMDLLSSE